MAYITTEAADVKTISGGGDSSMFGITLEQIKKIIEKRDERSRAKSKPNYNSVEDIITKLRVDKDNGLDSNNQQDLEQRRQAYGKNIIPNKPLNFLESPSQWLREHNIRQMQDESEKKRHTSVLRDHRLQGIPVSELVVGDICHIHAGEIIPADGIIIEANGFKVDESAMTGEEDPEIENKNNDVVVLSGTEAKEGSAKILVVAVGPNSQVASVIDLVYETDN